MVSRLLAAPERIVAFIDLGTNSVRISVVRINANHSYTVLTQQKEVVRLGDGEFSANQLRPEAMERAALVCGKFAELARAFGADDIIAVATSATREADNQAEFLDRLRRDAQVDMRVISGNEEARLIYRGVASGIFLGEKTALFIDIGGGSTEIIIGDQQQYQFLDSFKLGAIRLSNLYLSQQLDAVSPTQYRRLCDHVRNVAIRSLQRARTYPLALAVGSSGTIENLANVAMQLCCKRPLQPDDAVSYAQLHEAIMLLCALPLEERRSVPGLNPERADIIIGGAAILETLMGELALPELRVSTRSLRDGLLVEYLARMDSAPLVADLSMRERNVLQLGRQCAFDEAHARTVARLALDLFDSASTAGLHALGPWERELLGYAALLHDLGAFLSYHNHQTHSYYFIRHAELLGFDQTEIAVLAATAYFHRKTFPRKKHAPYAALDERAQGIVRTLCILLRIAESLDRSHTGAVASARLVPADDAHIALTICATQDCPLERWGVRNHRDAFFKAFGKHLRVDG